MRLRSEHSNATLVVAVYTLFIIWIAATLFLRIEAGGEHFQQGDWLINNASGFVRRGIGGSFLIWAHDSFGIDILRLLGAFQFGFLFLFVAGLLIWVVQNGSPDRIVLLLLSPAFILLWFANFEAGFRKEIVGLLAFVPLIYSTKSFAANTILGLLSVALLTLSMLLHEANAFFLPFYLFLLYARCLWLGFVSLWVLIGALACVSGAVSVWIALAYASVGDADQLCAPLLQRNLSPSLCSGAISWMDRSLSEAVYSVFQVLKSRSQASFLGAYVLAFVPIYLALKPSDHSRRFFYMAVASAIFLGPLYIIAFDWGRWIFMHISVLTLIILAQSVFGNLQGLRNPLATRTFVFFMFLNTLWSMDHIGGELIPGYAMTAEKILKDVISYTFSI